MFSFSFYALCIRGERDSSSGTMESAAPQCALRLLTTMHKTCVNWNIKEVYSYILKIIYSNRLITTKWINKRTQLLKVNANINKSLIVDTNEWSFILPIVGGGDSSMQGMHIRKQVENICLPTQVGNNFDRWRFMENHLSKFN